MHTHVGYMYDTYFCDVLYIFMPTHVDNSDKPIVKQSGGAWSQDQLESPPGTSIYSQDCKATSSCWYLYVVKQMTLSEMHLGKKHASAIMKMHEYDINIIYLYFLSITWSDFPTFQPTVLNCWATAKFMMWMQLSEPAAGSQHQAQ